MTIWIQRGLVVLVLVVAVVGAARWFEPAALERMLREGGPLAGLGLMALQSLISPIPFALVVIALGAALGPFLGALVAWVGELVGASLAYWLARLGWRAQTTPEWLEGGRTFWALLGLRLLPGLSFDLVSYACGAARVPYSTFIASTMLGMIPRTFALVLFGHTLWTDPREASLLLLLVLPLAWLGWQRIRQDARRRGPHEQDHH